MYPFDILMESEKILTRTIRLPSVGFNKSIQMRLFKK